MTTSHDNVKRAYYSERVVERQKWPPVTNRCRERGSTTFGSVPILPEGLHFLDVKQEDISLLS